MLKKNHPLYQYTSSSEKLGIPTVSTLPKKSKKGKSKFNNKSAGPYVNEDAGTAPGKKTVAVNQTVTKEPETATEHPHVNIGPDEEEFEPNEWFSNTTYYEYFDQYMIGLDLGGIDYFKNALNLQEAWVQTIDDCTFLDNNLTYMFVWENKSQIVLAESWLDLTGFFAGALSDIAPYSYEFLYVESKLYWEAQYALMDKDITIWI